MKTLIDPMVTLSFKDYNQALLELRSWLDSGNIPEKLEDADFFFILRPYCWFLHDPGFQDVLNICETALQEMIDNKEVLWEETNPLLGNKFMGIATFLATYVEYGDYNPSEWRMMFASPEVNVNVTAKEYAEKLKESNASASAVFTELSELFFEIEGAKHVSYWILRRIAVDYIDFIESLIHTLPGADQAYILHAMDEQLGNESVISFYKRFIQNTSSEFLKEETIKYLAQVEA
jgi:hypothetical protein